MTSKEPIRPAVWAVTIAVAFSYMGVGVVATTGNFTAPVKLKLYH